MGDRARCYAAAMDTHRAGRARRHAVAMDTYRAPVARPMRPICISVGDRLRYSVISASGEKSCAGSSAQLVL